MALGLQNELKIQVFAELIARTFQVDVFLVGSALNPKGSPYRDVDVRIMLQDDEYQRMGLGDPDEDGHSNERWRGTMLAFSSLGKAMTGLEIDFQIQSQSEANKSQYNGPASCIAMSPCGIRVHNG